MDQKSITFLIVSNRGGTTRRVTITTAWIKAAMVFSILAVVIFSATLVDYAGLLVQSDENKRLKAENSLLNNQFQVVEEKLNSLESGLERVKSFSTKLRLITDSQGAKDQNLQLAMGPVVRSQAVDMVERKGTDSYAPTDGVSNINSVNPDLAAQTRNVAGIVNDKTFSFLDRAPLDSQRGELAVMGQRDYASLSIRIDQAIQGISLQEQGIMDLWGRLREKQNFLAATPSIKPVAGWFTSRFGYRDDPLTNSPTMHHGLDIAASPGTPVKSPADGIVSFAGYDAGYGKLVSIDHGYGVVTRYGHNSRIFVKVGQRVSRYDVIAAVGNTGRSTGPHLHYEVRVNNIPVDPSHYILH